MSQITISDNLQSLINNSLPGTPEQKAKFLGSMMSFYSNEVKKATEQGHTPMNIMAGYGVAMDKVLNEKNAESTEAGIPPSCKTGCSHCCHYYVSCSDLEAKAIIEYCREYNVLIEPQYLKKQAAFDKKTYGKQFYTACQFLSIEGTCEVYEVRPLNCRKLYVTTPPELCDTEKCPGGKVARIFNLEAECMDVAISDGIEQSLPQAILKNL